MNVQSPFARCQFTLINLLDDLDPLSTQNLLSRESLAVVSDLMRLDEHNSRPIACSKSEAVWSSRGRYVRWRTLQISKLVAGFLLCRFVDFLHQAPLYLYTNVQSCMPFLKLILTELNYLEKEEI